jgi:hypothetical protein
MEDPTLTWVIFGLAFMIGGWCDGYARGLAARPPVRPCPPTRPCPPIPIVAAPRRAAREPPMPPKPDRVSVRIGRDVVVVDASSLTDR